MCKINEYYNRIHVFLSFNKIENVAKFRLGPYVLFTLQVGKVEKFSVYCKFNRKCSSKESTELELHVFILYAYIVEKIAKYQLNNNK